MIQALYDAVYTGWTFFLLFFVSVTVIMLSRQLLAVIFYTKFKRGRILQGPATRRPVTLFVTIYDEDVDILEESLSGIRRAFSKYCSEFRLVAIVDGYSKFPVKGPLQAGVAEKYADLVLITNACSKRQNLRNMMEEAKSQNFVLEFSAFLDSDTILDNDEVAQEIMRPFADASIGGVSSLQRVLDPQSTPERIGDWLESARIHSSMAAGSLFGQVGCLPGRLYVVRSSIVKDRMNDLVEDYWKTPFLGSSQCIAGDDRVITNFVLQAGYKTVMMPTAGVKTLVPDTYPVLWKTWERWGRSSQGYTLRSWRWIWRQPFVLFQYLSDMAISLATVYLVMIHWPYHFFFGDGQIPFFQAMVMTVMGMCLTVMFRQVPHLIRNPRDILLIPVFAVVLTIGQFVRVKALFTPHKIGVWGTRAGSDEKDGLEIWVKNWATEQKIQASLKPLKVEVMPQDG